MRPIFIALVVGLCPTLVRAQCTLHVVMELTKPPAAGSMLKVAVCRTVPAFESEVDAVVRNVAAQYPTTRVTFEDLPPGRVAVKAYVDENANDKLDVNTSLIPTEPYGFSNNAMRLMGAPYFSQAQFDLREGMNVQRITMR